MSALLVGDGVARARSAPEFWPGAAANPHAGQIESNYDEITDSFDNMNLKAELLRGVYAYGFERPSAIQQRAIMPVIKGEFGPPPPWPSTEH